jgi:hypothetical protein
MGRSGQSIAGGSYPDARRISRGGGRRAVGGGYGLDLLGAAARFTRAVVHVMPLCRNQNARR